MFELREELKPLMHELNKFMTSISIRMRRYTGPTALPGKSLVGRLRSWPTSRRKHVRRTLEPLRAVPRGRWKVEQSRLRSLLRDHGALLIASEAFNCSAPDTGNMETLLSLRERRAKEAMAEPLLEAKSVRASQ